MTEQDDGNRFGPALVISTRDLPDGRVRVILDDAVSTGENPSKIWRTTFLFTWTELDREAFLSSSAPEDFYRELGRMVAVRLHARRTVEGYEED